MICLGWNDLEISTNRKAGGAERRGNARWPSCFTSSKMRFVNWKVGSPVYPRRALAFDSNRSVGRRGRPFFYPAAAANLKGMMDDEGSSSGSCRPAQGSLPGKTG